MIIISVITFSHYCHCYYDYIANINCLEKRRRKIKNENNNIPSAPPDLGRNKKLKRIMERSRER